ncbi:MAG: hypothetical protein ABI306_01040 [Caulobacteraceae bacterium]
MRLIGRIVRPFGYDIRKRDTINLLPFKPLVSDNSLQRVRLNINGNYSNPAKTHPRLDVIKIVFRTCLSPERLSKSGVRIENLPIVDIVERCFISLVNSINYIVDVSDIDVKLIIMDDRSDKELFEKITEHGRKLRCRWSTIETDRPGQGASLRQQFKMATDDDAIFYFCEDGFIHEEVAIYEMWRFYNRIYELSGQHLVIHPQEHENLYKESYGPCYLFLSDFRHWRSVSDATHVIFTHSFVVKKYWRYFKNTKYVGEYNKRRLGSERRTTNRLFRHLPCFAPIPALAGHLQATHLLPPFFDWRALWNESAPDR